MVDVMMSAPDTSRVAVLNLTRTLCLIYREGFVENRYMGVLSSCSTSLHIVLPTGNSGAVRLLLEHGADVNAQNESNLTPFLLASLLGSAKTMRLRIEREADVDAWGERYSTPLLLASPAGHAEIARLLIGHGANINA